jgi:hypothetical protein
MQFLVRPPGLSAPVVALVFAVLAAASAVLGVALEHWLLFAKSRAVAMLYCGAAVA